CSDGRGLRMPADGSTTRTLPFPRLPRWSGSRERLRPNPRCEPRDASTCPFPWRAPRFFCFVGDRNFLTRACFDSFVWVIGSIRLPIEKLSAKTKCAGGAKTMLGLAIGIRNPKNGARLEPEAATLRSEAL